MKYKLLSGSPQGVESGVNVALANGWKLFGSPFAAVAKREHVSTEVVQAMIKPDSTDESIQKE